MEQLKDLTGETRLKSALRGIETGIYGCSCIAGSAVKISP